jgi:hypothetical protein
MKKVLTLIGVAFFATVINIQGQTNYLSFTNVTVTAYTGYRYAGNTSQSQAILGTSVDLWEFNAGKKLGYLDLGLCCDVALGADTKTVDNAALGIELMKNYDTLQIYANLEGQRDFTDKVWGVASTEGMRYNLHRADKYCVWVGTSIRFSWLHGDTASYEPGIQTGIAF